LRYAKTSSWQVLLWARLRCARSLLKPNTREWRNCGEIHTPAINLYPQKPATTRMKSTQRP
jgi:hypothetical protein